MNRHRTEMYILERLKDVQVHACITEKQIHRKIIDLKRELELPSKK